MDPAPPRIAALPCWRGEPRAERLRGGLSNEIWRVEDEAGAHVVRFGEDYPFHHVSRAREREVARAAARVGLGPPVEWTGGDAMVTAFVASETWDAGRVRAEPARVAALVRAFHEGMGREVAGAPALFEPLLVARDYARTLEAAGSPWAGEAPRLLGLAEALDAMRPPARLAFGHNDLLPANILDDGGRLWLIDFEYAGWADPMFDLAGVASNAGMDREAAGALLSAYRGAPPGEAEWRGFDAMQALSLIREAMWAMVSGVRLSAPGVDYDAYARENLGKLGAAVEAVRGRWGSV